MIMAEKTKTPVTCEFITWADYSKCVLCSEHCVKNMWVTFSGWKCKLILGETERYA